MEDYRTVEGRARAELEEKRSRFIASLAFADTEQKALDFLAEIREANRTAGTMCTPISFGRATAPAIPMTASPLRPPACRCWRC